MENTPTALRDRRTRIGRTESGIARGAPARRTMGAYTAAPMSSWISRSGTILIRRRRIVLTVLLTPQHAAAATPARATYSRRVARSPRTAYASMIVKRDSLFDRRTEFAAVVRLRP